MNSPVPKQFLQLMGLPVLYHTIQRFIDYSNELNIVVVLPAGNPEATASLLRHFESVKNIKVVEGGETRFHSVQNGLRAIDTDGIVFIHDGVRPFVSIEVLERCYQGALKFGNAVPSIPLKDSIRFVQGNDNRSVSRSEYQAMQTPQTFRIADIQAAFKQAFTPAFTDEAAVFEQAGHTIRLVDGNDENIKITTPADLALANYLLNQSSI